MAMVMPGLRPTTQGALMTERPATLGRKQPTLAVSMDGPLKPGGSSLGGLAKSASTSSQMSANAKLSIIEIEALLREKVKLKYDELQRGFQNYDIDQSLCITKGEFRRVLESYCFPLTSDQFEGIMHKVQVNSNGTVRYCDFLDKFYGMTHDSHVGQEKWVSGTHKYVQSQGPKEHINLDQLEKFIKEKIAQNIKNVIKAFHLFDYNRDGKIQRHELRKVIENYCFKLTDQQYDKLWQRYDFHHTGLLDYSDFLKRLGINVERSNNAQSPKGTKGAMLWNKHMSHVPLVAPRQVYTDETSALRGLNFDQIEAEFRKRMRSNYVNLKKAFLAFDAQKDGFIGLEDLKSVLNNFTLPMTDQLFGQLMDRCGIKGNGKVSWEFFLEKFQDPQGPGNGQTVPMKFNHKFFPIRETEQYADADDLLKLLHNHVENGYSSFKKAFLELDKNRDGFIGRKDFRRVIEGFKIKLSSEQFRLLCNRLDPNQTNKISYHQFLALFEPRETREGHKWLNSVHRYNSKPKPAILAWETVEDILREKITENWKYISSSLVFHDDKDTGTILTAKLKRILDRYCLPLSQQHYENILGHCETHSEGRVNYTEFMERLGVDVQPGDLIGLSTQIHEASKATEELRKQDQAQRDFEVGQVAGQRTTLMTPDEVIVRLKDRMAQHNHEIRKSFLEFDKSKRGKISKRDFRQVLSSMGFYMTQESFNELVNRVGFHKGKLSYSDFVAAFEDPRIGGSASEGNVHPNNHRVNPIRGDEISMTAEQCETKLLSKLRENFGDLRSAFYKFDDDHNGILNKENFRRLLDTFMFFVSDKEFERLCERHGITKQSRISYKDFLDQFEVRDQPHGHKWLNSDHRFNETREPNYLSAEKVHDALAEKAHRQWKDLSKAFCTLDKDGNGIITRRELKETLAKFILPINNQEFKKLWKRYDVEGKGHVTHQDFLVRLGAEQFAPGDAQGMSRRIVDDSYKSLDKHHQAMQERQEKITYHQAHRGANMTAEEVERQLRDRIRENYSGMYAAFKKYDVAQKGYLSVGDIQRVLVELNFFLTDDQFFVLLDKIGLKTNKSRLSYEDFLKAFEDGRKSSYGPRPEDVKIQEFDELTPTAAEEKLRNKIGAQVDIVHKALTAFDKDRTGQIKASDFRRVLDNFVFKMTDPQFRHLMSKVQSSTGGMVEYPMFMDYYSHDEQKDQDRWLDQIQQYAAPRTPQPLGMDEVHACISEVVSAHFYAIARAFAEIDYARIGVVAKDDFKMIMNKNIVRLTDSQFDRLWGTLKINDFGNLEYRDFLKRYSNQSPRTGASPRPPSVVQPPSRAGTEVAPSPAMFARRSKTPDLLARGGSRLGGQTPQSRQGSRMSDRNGQLYTPMVNAEHVERKIGPVIQKNWRDIQRQCRENDPENNGHIEASLFKDFLDLFGAALLPHEFDLLATKYDIHENGKFCYSQFLRHFVLGSRSYDEGLLSRRKLHQSKVQPDVGMPSNFYYDAMMRLRQSVLRDWKDMRRMFRGIDKTGQGIVTPIQFRHVLRQFGINLNEDEFYHLLTFYDKDLRGQISYNDFIAVFLRTA